MKKTKIKKRDICKIKFKNLFIISILKYLLLICTYYKYKFFIKKKVKNIVNNKFVISISYKFFPI